jgi:hypothetical protein
MQLPEIERKRLIDGIWDAFEGQKFCELNRELHGFDFECLIILDSLCDASGEDLSFQCSENLISSNLLANDSKRCNLILFYLILIYISDSMGTKIKPNKIGLYS